MKCPECGDTDKQRSLAAVLEPSARPLSYRCGVCGRLYELAAIEPTPSALPPVDDREDGRA